MPRYRKKPVVIEAVCWRPNITLSEWPGGWPMVDAAHSPFRRGPDGALLIHTLEGEMRCDIGAWIIRGVKGEFYSCQDDVFLSTYERAEEPEILGTVGEVELGRSTVRAVSLDAGPLPAIEMVGPGGEPLLRSADWGHFDFAKALHHLKEGCRVTREGWNGKGAWLCLVPGDQWGLGSKVPYDTGAAGAQCLPFIGMRTAQGAFVPWLASQTDLLAEDWRLP